MSILSSISSWWSSRKAARQAVLQAAAAERARLDAEWTYYGTVTDTGDGISAIYVRHSTKEAEARRKGRALPLDYPALVKSGKTIPLKPIPWDY